MKINSISPAAPWRVPINTRDRQKSDRRSQLLAAAEQLIAERGFLAVRLEDIGAAAGVSTRLLAGGQAVAEAAPDAGAALAGLIEFHLDFALDEPDLIRIQDRDLANLPASAQRQVRRAQRRYVETWVAVLREVDPGVDEESARVRAHAAFGLLNSTPHSVGPAGRDSSREVLRAMTAAALSLNTNSAGRRPAGRPSRESTARHRSPTG